MKKWLLEHFLPMWAKETVMRDNRRLVRQNRALEQKNAQLQCYIRGLHTGLGRNRRQTGGRHEAS